MTSWEIRSDNIWDSIQWLAYDEHEDWAILEMFLRLDGVRVDSSCSQHPRSRDGFWCPENWILT